ncbi:hypothetical protein RHSIM_RhsimUnG0230400 [Rhododendron simsii]|uniref:Uncharacterized protein n=1 Tax=Rhododendron simsii TaxID=118357 RepID=A0A834FTG3_RHOSS|nr:hypothetical protein RHSIM_RhsimUnG0230400 [Rhododendron simsii]
MPQLSGKSQGKAKKARAASKFLRNRASHPVLQEWQGRSFKYYLIRNCISQPLERDRVRRMDQKLYKAAKEGNVSCLSEQVMNNEHGIFFLQRTQHSNNIVHIAARAGRDTFVAEALQRFPFLSDQVNSQGDTPLLVAARFGHLQVVKTLADPNNELPMQDDMATAKESGTNSRSSRHQRDMEKGLVDHQFEEGTL